MVTVKASALLKSYTKMKNGKVDELYVDSLNKVIGKLEERLRLLKVEWDDKQQADIELIKAKDDKYELLETIVKNGKVRFVYGGGGNTNTTFNSGNIYGKIGLMFKHSKIFTLNIGVSPPRLNGGILRPSEFMVGGEILFVW